MDEAMQEVSEVLQANGGSMIYRPLYDAVSDKVKRILYPALRQMKKLGSVSLVNKVDRETKRATFTITWTARGDG